MEGNTVCDSVRAVAVLIDNRQRQTYHMVMRIFGDVACAYESKWLPRSKQWQNDKHRQADNTGSATTNNFRHCINTCNFFLEHVASVRVFIFPPRCKIDLRSSGILPRVD